MPRKLPKYFFNALALFFCALLILNLSACKGVAEPKPHAAVRKHAQIKKPAHGGPAAQALPVPKIAIGTQQGGARQGVPLSLLRVVSTLPDTAADEDGSAELQPDFESPRGITSDGASLYIADSDSHTIHKVDIESGAVSTLAGMAGKKGSRDGKGAVARFNRPYGITTDGQNLYVTDSNNHCVRQIDIESGLVTTIAGEAGEVGYADGIGKHARFFIPEGITTDGSRLYVSDTHNHSIRKIEIKNSAVTTIAGLSGVPGFFDDSGTKARFSYPKGITTDGRNLYLADFGNNQIRKIVLASGVVSTLAGKVIKDGLIDAQIEPVQFNYPSGISSDGVNLYIADTFNRVVRKVVIASGEVITLAGKEGVQGAQDASGTEARFSDPIGITTDGAALYVTDPGNHGVRKIR